MTNLETLKNDIQTAIDDDNRSIPDVLVTTFEYIAALEAQLAALSWARWVSVDERLPELNLSISYGFTWESDKVIVSGKCACCGEFVASGRYYANENRLHTWWWDRRHGDMIDCVKAWMPLPPAPARETKET